MKGIVGKIAFRQVGIVRFTPFFALSLALMLFIVSCKDQKHVEGTDLEMKSTGLPEVDKITRLIEKDRQNDQLYYQRAEAYYNNEMYDLTARDVLRAIELDSTRWEYHHLLADAYLDDNQSREALRVLDNYLDMVPDRIGTRLKLAEFQYILLQYDEAIKSVDKVIQKSPQESEAYYMLGNILLGKKDTVKAMNAFQTAVEMNSGNIDAWLVMGNLLTGQNNPKAIRYLDNGLSVHPGHPTLLQSKGYALQHFGNYRGSLQTFDAIIKDNPQNPEAHFNKGVVYLKMDSFSQAERAFQLAQQLDPTNYLFYLNKGIALELQGDLEAALEQYEQAERLGGDEDVRVLESIAIIRSKMNN